MVCPNCGKKLSKKIETSEQDGGIVLTFHCDKCESTFEAFVSPTDLEIVYMTDQE